MTTRSQRDFLEAQLLSTQQLRAMYVDHPLMARSMEIREQELQNQLNELPLGQKEARAVLFFSGGPVQGSIGIDVTFTGRVLEPFQSMVMAQYADMWHGVVGTRGKRSGEADSKLLLTSLPRGSFGLELVRAESDELFEEDQLADTLTQVTRLVQSSASSDVDFALELDHTAPRVIENLKTFLEVVSKGKAGLKLETGDSRCKMTPLQAHEAYERVAGTQTETETLYENGNFRGALLDSWKFNFMNEDGHLIEGKLSDNLSPEEVSEFMNQFLNRPCVAEIERTVVVFRNGKKRTTHVLNNLMTRDGTHSTGAMAE